MARTKRGAVIASMMMLITLIISACKTPYSTPPPATNPALSATSLFETPLGQTPALSMSDIANFGTSTALALTGTPLDVATQTASTPIAATQDPNVTATPSPLTSNPAFTSTATLAVSGTLPTSAPVGARPATYTLQRGEFPYCIARRFDVDPSDLLARNNLTTAEAYSLAPGTVLSIPQSGSFPGTRALASHPTTYTVLSGESIYAVACKFGDVDPAAIAQANNIAVSATLTAGQSLSIP